MFDFGKLFAPKQTIRQTDHRSVKNVVQKPRVCFYNPDDLKYPDTQGPPVPGNGGYVSLGCQMVAYGAPTWDRDDVALAGPVQEFFRQMMTDTRVKRT